MFDDKPLANGSTQPPQNLPLAEPEDIFSGSDSNVPQPMAAAPASEIPNQPSALDAGILQPKIESPMEPPMASAQPRPQMQPMQQPPMAPPAAPVGSDAEMYKIKEPSLSRGIMTTVIIIVVVLILGGAGWWVYNFLMAPKTSTDTLPPNTDTTTVPSGTDTNNGNEQTPNDTTSGSDSSNSNAQVIDDTVLFGEKVDSDGDGLDDAREATLGTNPNDWDSDKDELGDGDEVIVFLTQPLNPDTDGDTFKDGQEVKSGYNPNGPGRFPTNPTATSTSAAPVSNVQPVTSSPSSL